MTRTEVLHEYESTELSMSAAEAQALTVTADGVLTVRHASTPGRYVVTATSTVGTIYAGGVQFLIRPKIRPENLFLLLEVGLPDAAWRDEAFDYTQSTDLLPAFIGFFARTLETTLARGLVHSYRHKQDKLVALRGRIDVSASFKAVGVRVPVPCSYDEYTADVFENHYLKAALRRALRVPAVKHHTRRRLMRQLVALEGVSDIHVEPRALDRCIITRLNAHYEPALRLARLLLENLSLTDRAGAMAASSFLIDMNQLFESFVEERLRRALAGRLDVLGQHPEHLALRRQVSMRPDLVFCQKGQEVYVGDIKYKLTGDAKARSADYYQLLAYTTAMDLPEGVLLYCLRDGGDPERQVTVKHVGKVLWTLAIDLSGPTAAVERAIADTADWIYERALASAPQPVYLASP